MNAVNLKLIKRTDMRPVTSSGRKLNKTYRTREHLTEAEMAKLLTALKANRHGVIIEKKRLSEWTSLEPRVTIPDASNFSSITIEINGVRVH